METLNNKIIQKRLFLVVNVDWFFLSHRLPIAQKAIENGFEVTLITKDTGHREEIENYGIRFMNIGFERTRVNLYKEFLIYKKLKLLYKKEKPEIVHHVTLKPIILGSLAAKINPKIGIVNAVSGLGIMFSGKGSILKRLLTIQLLKLSFRLKNQVKAIFQNLEDRKIFIDFKLTDPDNAILIKGSGIDLNEFSYFPPNKSDKIKVLIAARMLYPKGFDEFSQAAQIISSSGNYSNVIFEMAGDLDLTNPTGIPKSIINKWEKERNVKWLGHISNMKSKIIDSDIIVFPSYYGEGVPKFLIEACSIGRPIVTTSHPGCKDCVDDNINGFLVDTKNVQQLVEKIKLLLDSRELCEEFGKRSRIKAESEFSIDIVIEKTLSLYNKLLIT